MSHLSQVLSETPQVADGPQRLRLLSYNIQAGISTSLFRHYLTRSWKHVVHHPQRFHNLDRIAGLLQDYDLVGLQELDAGSMRSGYVNLAEYLANRASFPFWYDQTNRRLGQLARHSIGILSRYQPSEITEHRLPGRIPGRGVLAVRFGDGPDALLVLIIHLALGQGARLRQLAYVSELVNAHRHVILMGDMNCRSSSREMEFLMKRTDMREPEPGLNTFPSWRPAHNIDHILVTPTLKVDASHVVNYSLSDHLPIAMEVTLPAEVQLKPRA